MVERGKLKENAEERKKNSIVVFKRVYMMTLEMEMTKWVVCYAIGVMGGMAK